MVAKTIPLSCPECGIEYSVTSANWESIMFCPFCGEGNSCAPYDDVDDDPGVYEPDVFDSDD